MKKIGFRSRIFLIIFLIILAVMVFSWVAFGWDDLPYGWILLPAAAIPAIVSLAADILSILKDTRPPGPEGEADEKLPRLPRRGALPDPGLPPPGSRMDQNRNECFTGRGGDLLALADALLFAGKAGRAAAPPLVVTGLGGTGKTQLAVEFCCRYGRFFEGVHWLDCSGGRLEGEVAECGRRMNVQPWPDQQPEQVQITLRAWERSRRRLLVLDNLEGPGLLQKWLPRLSRCRLLVTARGPDWPPDLGVRVRPLGMLAEPESRELLRNLAPRLGQFPDAELDAVSKKLGDLPLALDLAGRYLLDRKTLSPAAYLAELEQQENLLRHSSLLNWVKTSPTGHATSLAASFKLSWDRLAGEGDECPPARRVFLLAGWCAPNAAIPRGLLAQAAAAPEEDFDRALRRLTALGLVERMQGGPALHPLLAAFAQLLQTEDEKKANLALLGRTLADLSDEANQTGLPQNCAALRPHLEALAPAAEQAEPEISAPLWNNLGYFLHAIADPAGARVCFERALRIDEVACGPEHPAVAADVNNLGSVLQDLGDPAGARACYERALRIDEVACGPEHPAVATDANNLGNALLELGDPAGARACFERALRIDEAVYGPEHPKVAIRVNNLGNALQDLGNLAGARDCYERALRIDEAVYGPEHPEVATDANNLGFALETLGDPAGARACYERALRIFNKFLPPGHPYIRLVRANLEECGPGGGRG